MPPCMTSLHLHKINQPLKLFLQNVIIAWLISVDKHVHVTHCNTSAKQQTKQKKTSIKLSNN